MIRNRRQLEHAIRNALEISAEPDSPNRISIQNLTEWAIDYLTEYDEELSRLPELANSNHWNLWMIDADLNRDAIFAVLIFRPNDVEVFCGRGKASDIRSFADNYPANPDELRQAMSVQFTIPCESVCVSRRIANRWLGRK
jgi:hypothetical protein